jgi:tetratricopeptide (TPR) repeat protein
MSKETFDFNDWTLADIERILEFNPDRADFWNVHGGLHYNSGAYDKAIESFTKSIALDPAPADYWSNRAASYTEHGDYGKAMADYNKAESICEANHRGVGKVYADRSHLYGKMGEWAKSGADITRALRSDRKNSSLYARRAYCYTMTGQAKEAIADYGKAIALNPDNAGYWYHRALLRCQNHERDSALPDYIQAAERGGPWPLAWYALGNYYYDTVKGMIEIVRQLIAKEIRDEEARVQCVTYVEDRLLPDLAVDVDKHFRNYRKNEDVLEEGIIALTKEAVPGMMQLAFRFLNMALTLDKDYVDALLCRGNSHALLGDKAKARSDYKHILALVPAHPGAAKALEGLKKKPVAIDPVKIRINLPLPE